MTRLAIDWCQADCAYERHVHTPLGVVEIAAVPENLFWTRLRKRWKILDSFYQGTGEVQAIQALEIIIKIFDRLGTATGSKFTVTDVPRLTEDKWTKISYLIGRWARKLDPRKGPTDIDVALVVGGIWQILNGSRNKSSAAVSKEESLEAVFRPVPRLDSLANSSAIHESSPERAYERWSAKEERALIEAFQAGTRIDEIARILRRQPGGTFLWRICDIFITLWSVPERTRSSRLWLVR